MGQCNKRIKITGNNLKSSKVIVCDHGIRSVTEMAFGQGF